MPRIRAARRDELELLRAIERSAGSLFAEIGLDDVAAHEPDSVEALSHYLTSGHAWVICDADADLPVGYALVDIVDGAAHLEQLSVRSDCGRRGLGTALLAHVCRWAGQHDLKSITLTTFRDVLWNAPFYAREGFRVLDENELGPELRSVRRDETEHGLNPATRVCMRREL